MQFVPFVSTACAGSVGRTLFCSIIRLFKGLNGGVVLKKLLLRCTRFLAAFAMVAAVSAANRACGWFTYQPELPESVRKLRKF